jgi:hypothetical protein
MPMPGARWLCGVAFACACHRAPPAPVAHSDASAEPSAPSPSAPPVATPSTSASASIDAPPPSEDQQWCLSPSGRGEDVNDVIRAPLKLSGKKAATRLVASTYAKALLPGPGKLLAQAYYCPDPKRCAAATTQAEKRATCDYLMRVYLFDPGLAIMGGRAVMYLDIDDHVDATDGLLWREDATGWTSRKL